MKRFTINIPEQLKRRINQTPSINWPEIAKQGVLKKLEQMEKFEQLVNKGEL